MKIGLLSSMLKIGLGVLLFFSVGGPFLIGLGFGTAVWFVNLATGLFLYLFGSPLGLLVVGLLLWYGMGRWRESAAAVRARVVTLDPEDYTV